MFFFIEQLIPVADLSVHVQNSNVRIKGSCFLCLIRHMHSLMPVGFLVFLSMHDFLPGCLFAVVVI